jgi:hypothetical protein
MEFKGIKGEWSFEQEYDHKYKQETFVISSHDTNTSTFASVWSGSDDGIEEAYANAKLIAKSPELLDFITRICGEMLRNDFVLSERWYEQAQQLIKEATEL